MSYVSNLVDKKKQKWRKGERMYPFYHKDEDSLKVKTRQK